MVDRIRDQILAGSYKLDQVGERYEELRDRVPEAVLDDATRAILLYHLNRRWTEHLAYLAELREGIPALRGDEDVGDEHAQDQACDAADDINLDTTCPPRVPGATKICLRGA